MAWTSSGTLRNTPADQVQVFVLGCLPIDLAQELQPLDVAMAFLARADHRTVQDAERGKQRRGAMALVVMGMVPARPFLSGSPGWVRSSACTSALLVATRNLKFRLLRGELHPRVRAWRDPPVGSLPNEGVAKGWERKWELG